ncbi:TPA: hypothetical protein ACGQUH_000885 [Serratia liquefaciens]|nr:hypothetical protein [Serratia liquefaciens]
MTQTLTTEQVQEIYEAAVHVEATLGDPDAEFDLYCKLDDVGGVEATIRKLIDMMRAANREAQPVLYASEETLAYAKEGEKSLVTWSEPMGDAMIPLFTAPPAPAVPEEMTGSIAMTQYRIKPSNYKQWVKGWNACRAAMLAQPVSSGYKLVPVEPTAEMISSAMGIPETAIAIYKRMLAAAPEGGNG